MTAHSTLLKGAIGGASLAVLAAAALAFGSGSLHSVAAATPSPAPGGVKYRPTQGIFLASQNPPTITGLELQPVVAAGGEVKIDGQNFGTERGNVCLRWSTVLVQNAFTAGNSLCLTVLDWQDSRIIALVPSDVEGVPDQTAQLAVYPAAGGVSNSLDMQFVATREEVLVNSTKVKATIDCGDATEKDTCDLGVADHFDGWFISFGNSDTDRYHVQLANGWTFDDFKLYVTQGDAALQGQPQLGGNAIDVAVHWSVGGTDSEVKYGFSLYALGPKGVPLQ